MEYTFQKHKLSESERMWLLEVLHSTPFDPKIAKVKLFGKLPEEFDPHQIDNRLYAGGHIIPIGLWHLDQENVLLKAIDQVIRTIREMIIEAPGIETIKSATIAARTGLDEKTVGHALHELGQLGHFFSGSTGGSDADGISSIELTDEIAYDDYLRYSGLNNLLERVYVAHKPTRKRSSEKTVDTLFSLFERDLSDQDAKTRQLIDRIAIKPNTAFILMAMDPRKPDLVDVYTTIKDVCQEFSITAYRADDIEHQDRITDLILGEIRTSEYLIADLSYERPNVYYEVGFAHAINKKPILYRRAGTRLHFDLSVHNVPEYKNVTELREMLRKRFEAILGRQSKATK